jgi:predicted RNA-binding Zn-ribbon protein involved in translation (DUF1610 family)
MSYLKCTRCGLAIRVRAAYLVVYCPRCIARAHVAQPMHALSGRCTTRLVRQTRLRDAYERPMLAARAAHRG